MISPRLFRRLICCLTIAALATFVLLADGPGFRSRRQFEEHFAKHGAEFGNITPQQYLALAQRLRDTPKGGDILEETRSDGVISKFDRRHGYFGAYNGDRTIRTFFIPNTGERYFWRQLKTGHE